ncbi:MAG: DUF3613 domain-containing protein [Nevskiales bacterium]|nr:DUF3613 domain-containing protein [Nevskiales bacterium]
MKQTVRLVSAAVLVGGWALPLMAQEPAAEPRIGDQTRQWLELQQSGNASLGAIRPMPGDVADKVYERYLKSFEEPIPQQFDRESFVSDTGGS